MIVGMHQPHYLPWFGLLNKIASVDIFVLLDDVQFSKGSKMNRNKLICNNGEAKFITLPYNKKGALEIPFHQLEIPAASDWQEKHKNFILNNYKNFPYFNEIWNHISPIFEVNFKTINNVDCFAIRILLDMLDIKTKIVYQSELSKDNGLKNNDMIINLMDRLEADTYLSGNGARKYMDLQQYESKNIKVIFQVFQYPNYEKHVEHNETDLSILDMLFNCGIEKTKEFIHKSVLESKEVYGILE